MNDEAYRQVTDLFRLFCDQGLSELSVEDGDFKLHLSREGVNPAPPRSHRAPRPARQRGEAPEPSPRTVAVRAPLIGVFYRAPAPEAPPFVEIGDLVEEGETVCIVEAMKVFNEIKAEWRGRVVALPVENGSLVQAGDPLVVLEFLEGERGGEEG
jgi:acetyl-CoA carboxylase biotin carboxyl carrier protein